jgi:hypothetical protein
MNPSTFESIAGFETPPSKLTEWYLTFLGQNTNKPSGAIRFTEPDSTLGIQRGLAPGRHRISTTRCHCAPPQSHAVKDAVCVGRQDESVMGCSRKIRGLDLLDASERRRPK